MDHVTSQLPYAMLVALASVLGYIVVGFTQSSWFGFATAAVVMAVILLIFKSKGTE